MESGHMRILITGGAGFIGSHLADALLARGDKVTVLDNLSTGSRSNIPDSPDLRLVKGDVRNPGDVRLAIRGADAVIHAAAVVSVPLSVQDPKTTWDVNVGGTVNLLEAAESAGLDAFVYISSCAVYGDSPRAPIPESKAPDPISPYARSKLEGERACLDFWRKTGLPVVILRYFNVYGPRQQPGEYAGVMVKFTERIRSGKPPVIYGDGEQTRDFIHVSDVVRATVSALERRPAGEVINVGSGRAVTINELCGIFLEIAGRNDLKPVYAPPRPMEVRHSWADITKASKLLGFRPEIDIREGVRRLLAGAVI